MKIIEHKTLSVSLTPYRRKNFDPLSIVVWDHDHHAILKNNDIEYITWESHSGACDGCTISRSEYMERFDIGCAELRQTYTGKNYYKVDLRYCDYSVPTYEYGDDTYY